jgi:hypothetical protein
MSRDSHGATDPYYDFNAATKTREPEYSAWRVFVVTFNMDHLSVAP